MDHLHLQHAKVLLKRDCSRCARLNGIVQVAETTYTCTPPRGHILDYPGSDGFARGQTQPIVNPAIGPVSILLSDPFVWVTETNAKVRVCVRCHLVISPLPNSC